MRVFVVSKGSVLRSYREKWERMPREHDLELTLLLPERWGNLRAEVQGGHACKIILERAVFVGKNHLHFYPFLGKRIKEANPDVLHVDEEPYSFVTFQAMSLKGRSKALFFTWQNIYRQYPPPFRWFEQYNYARADVAMAASSEAGDVLRQKGFAKNIVLSAQYGVDPEVFKKREEPALREKLTGNAKFAIGYIGRLIAEKGICALLRAAATLGKECKVLLLGDGPFREELRRLAVTLGIEDRVLFVGNVPSSEIPRYLNCLDVLVLPSRTTPTWKEQLGRVIIEAMACEVPVVGSASGALPEVIGDAGLIFEEGDAEDLARTLGRIKEDEPLRTSLARKGRGRVLERYTVEKTIEETLRVYRGLMGEA